MYTYLITWLLVSSQIGSCPDRVKANSFGITPSANLSCAVLHVETKESKFKKSFKYKKEAILFLDSIQKYKASQSLGFSMIGDQKIEAIKLDSLKIK